MNIAIIKDTVCIDVSVFDNFETAESFFETGVWLHADCITILPEGYGINDKYENGEWCKYSSLEPTIQDLILEEVILALYEEDLENKKQIDFHEQAILSLYEMSLS